MTLSINNDEYALIIRYMKLMENSQNLREVLYRSICDMFELRGFDY